MSGKALIVVLLAWFLMPLPSFGQDNRPEANWVPFEQIESEGSVDLSGLRPSDRSFFERSVERHKPNQKHGNQLDSPLDRPCDTEVAHHFEPVVYPRSTFRAQLEDAVYILRGEVSATEQGFFHSTPGMALGIRVRDVLKAPSTSSVPEVVRFFYPWAEFQVSGVKICARGYHEGLEPYVGQEVLLALINAKPRDAGTALGGFLLEEEILFGLSSGGVTVPRTYGADADLIPEDSLDDLARWISRSVSSTSPSTNAGATASAGVSSRPDPRRPRRALIRSPAHPP